MLVPLRGMAKLGLVDESLVMDSWPVCEPVVVGSNVSVIDNVWPGLRVTGRVTGAKEKPLPITEMVFTVTAALPVESSVTTWVVECPTTTAPKEIDVAFTVN